MLARKNIKQIVSRALLLVAAAVFTASCVKDRDLDCDIAITEGEPSTVSFRVELPDMTPVTRAAGIDPDGDDVSHVNDLWVGIYNAGTGKRTGQYYASYNSVFDNSHDDRGHHEIEIQTSSGLSYIVAVANVDNNSGLDTDSGEAQPLRRLLNGADTWDKYKQLAITLTAGPQSIQFSGPGMLMSGIYYDDHQTHNYQSSIDGDDNPQPAAIYPGRNKMAGCVQLRRAVAYVRFNIQVDPAYKDFITFTPVSWQVCNLPGVGYVHEHKGGRNAADKKLTGLPADYNGDSYHNSLIFDGIQLFPTSKEGVSSFDFFQMENKHTAIANSVTQYNDREAEYTIGTDYDYGKNTGWYKSLVSEEDYLTVTDTYASPSYDSGLSNNNASFVVIRARLDYYYAIGDGNYTPVDPAIAKNSPENHIRRVGDAIYTIHLGYCEGKNGKTPTATTYADFNCRRNTKYTYNVYVSGVDQIRVEAMNDDEDSRTNGVEGSVTDVTRDVINLDSHYGVFNIRLSDRERMTFSWRIQSPFGDSVIDMMYSSENIVFDSPGIINLSQESERDKLEALPINQFYNWLQFRPTTGENVLAHYPGDPRLIGRTVKNADTQSPGEYYNTANIADYAGSGRTGANADDGTGVWYLEQLRDVANRPHTDVAGNAGYIEYLRQKKANPEYEDGRYTAMYDAQRWYTVFVDEYVYEYTYNDRLPSLTGESDEPGYVDDTMPIEDWRYFVNRPNRCAWIALINMQTSTDIESMYSNAAYFINQESIQTYYTNDSEQGLGIECTNESYRDSNLEWTDYHYYAYDDIDGLYNQYTYVIDKQYGESRWHHVLTDDRGYTKNIQDGSTKNISQSEYNRWNNRPRTGVLRHGTAMTQGHKYYIPDHEDQIMSACLARNRDLNNDGIIGANEIRWYLPTTSTYTRMILGSTSLRSPLFNLTEFSQYEIVAGAGTLYAHYVGSNNRIVWAEELAATGGRFGLYGNLRCVRNLGQEMNLSPEHDDDYTTVDPAYHLDEATRTVEMDFYSMSALREYTNGTISVHPVGDIRSYASRKFQYAQDDCTYINTRTNLNEYLNQWGELRQEVVWVQGGGSGRDFRPWWGIIANNTICGKYSEKDDLSDVGTWRVPNITELAILKILNVLSDENDPHPDHFRGRRYISCSYEYFNNRGGNANYPDYFKFFMGIANNGTFDITADIVSHTDMRVRCVRDVR